MFMVILFTIVKVWKQSKCPSVDEWINKAWHKHTHTHTHTHTHIHIIEYYTSIIINGILPFAATWMDLEGNMLSETSLIEKDKV